MMPGRGRAAGLVAATALIWVPLVLPGHPGALTLGALRVVPLEWPLILLALAACQGRGRVATALRAAVVAVLMATLVIKLADLATVSAYLRRFNPVIDTSLIPAAWHMASGALGVAPALAAVVAGLAVLAGFGAALWWATGRIAGCLPVRIAAPAALAVTGLVGLDLTRPGGVNPPGSASSTRLAGEHVTAAVAVRQDLQRFACAAEADPFAALPADAVLAGLRGRDVFLVIVESYGRAAVEDPRYATLIGAALEEAEARIAAVGLAHRSGWLESPVIGGLSWLAHASMLSGLTIDSQARYRALMTSERRTLMHFAREAGWTSAAVMPAITLDWPESAYYGYDALLDAAALEYRGPPFNWVTMPDQFTLAAFERALLEGEPRRPVFAEIALISSHAPWTPIPEPLPWEALGDGAIFAAQAASGDPPEVIWRDPDRIREQYVRALAYVIDIVGRFAARHAGGAPLIVVMGDHQPAPLISGEDGNRDVPVHVIGPAAEVAALADPGWGAGMVPEASAPVWPMAAFRDRFLAAFSGPGGGAPIVEPAPPFTGDDRVLGSCG